MKPAGAMLLLGSLLATVQIAAASLNQYFVCPTRTIFTDGSDASTNTFPNPSQDPATNFRAAILKCDSYDTGCFGVDVYVGDIELFPSVGDTGGLIAVSEKNSKLYLVEGLALRL